MHPSMFSVVGSEKETKSMFFIFWFKPCGMWHCFNL